MATSIDIYSKTQIDTKLTAKANFSTGGTAPATPAQGDFWYDTANGVMKYFDGTNWQTLTSGSGSVSWGAITGTLANQTDLQNALNAKQNQLTFDSAPTSGSGNPVTSGGVFSALATKQDNVIVTDQGTYYTLTF